MKKVDGNRMNFRQLSCVWQKMQRIKAKKSITLLEQFKTELTKIELLNKWAQMGRIIRYKNAFFTFENGMGCINNNGQVTIGVTISEFLQILKNGYDFVLKN